MSETSIERTGIADGNRWKAVIEVSAGGRYSIRSLSVTSAEGNVFPTYSERTAMHDGVDGAVREAGELARSIARPE